MNPTTIAGSTPIIETKGLSKSFGPVKALEHLDLTVCQGEIFGFLGPNGAGKTTTIKILMGFLKPTGGIASMFGLDCWTQSTEIKSRTGFLPDLPSFYDNLTGSQLLDHLQRLQGADDAGSRNKLCNRLELSTIDLARKVGDYSSGMRQKLGIVQAFQHDPELVIMDEPSASLDPLMQHSLLAILHDFQSADGTVFVSSHVLAEVEQMCGRVAIIRDGRIAAVEDVEAIRSRVPRRIEIVFSKDFQGELLPIDDVEIVSRDGRRFELVATGDINDIIRTLSKYELQDLVIQKPGLEDIFLSFYERGAEEQSGC